LFTIVEELNGKCWAWYQDDGDMSWYFTHTEDIYEEQKNWKV
jgi:hypothetical protein